MTDINDTKHYAQWLLDQTHAHSELMAPEGPHTCEFCPWGAKTREPYSEIWNDVSEAHYLCPVLDKEVWGEDPQCRPHQTMLLTKIVETAADWETFKQEKDAAAQREREVREAKEALRQSGLEKLSPEERSALGL